MACGIYKITNLINGKSYIGQSKNITTRWRRHRTSAYNKNDCSYEYPLYRAIRKYGLENFSFEILEECLVKELDEKERFYIEKFNSFEEGYNQNKGGLTGNHSKLSEENLKEIIFLLQTTDLTNVQIGERFNVSENTVCGINTGYFWKNDSLRYPIREKVKIEKSSKKISNIPDKNELFALLTELQNFSAVARIFEVSDNAVRKWCVKYDLPTHTSDYKTKKIKNKPQNDKKSVKMIDLKTNEVIKIFPTIADAERYLTGNSTGGSHIGQVCKGERRSALGYNWEFI